MMNNFKIIILCVFVMIFVLWGIIGSGVDKLVDFEWVVVCVENSKVDLEDVEWDLSILFRFGFKIFNWD